MTTKFKLFIHLAVLACCLGGLAGAATAAAFDFHFAQGPAEMVTVLNDYRQFHSHLTNTGDNADSYSLVVTREQPVNWTFNVCYGGVCYPATQTAFTVPAMGDLLPGETVDFDFDVTSLFDEGTATYTVAIVSNGDNSVAGTYTFDVVMPTEDRAMLLAAGEGVTSVPVFDFGAFHPVLYNAGLLEDSYTLTMTRNHSANWTTTFCYGGICYTPTQTTGQIPADGGTIAGGGAVPIDIDFTVLFDEGIGSVTLTLTSNTDPSLSSTAVYTVTTGSVVAVDDVPGSVLSAVRAAPNPFNPMTDIRFTVGGDIARDVAVDIYDATGRRVRTLAAAAVAPGAGSLTWDGRGDRGDVLPAGVYLASVRAGGEQQTLKLSLVK
jgi:hypothetical protein